jgi:hypothetical protein
LASSFAAQAQIATLLPLFNRTGSPTLPRRSQVAYGREDHDLRVVLTLKGFMAHHVGPERRQVKGYESAVAEIGGHPPAFDAEAGIGDGGVNLPRLFMRLERSRGLNGAP